MEQIVEKIKVGIADFNIVKSNQVISTSGLGSCVGLVLYDELRNQAGMVHIMLPDSSLSRTAPFKVGKFADTGIEALIQLLDQEGSPLNQLKAKMAGGSQMFKLSSGNEKMNIGPKNVLAIEQILSDKSIPVISKDVGGNKGRTIEFNPQTSMLKVKTVYEGVTYI